jgi:hypothetical protein
MSPEDRIRQLLEDLLTQAMSCEQWGTFRLEFDKAGKLLTEARHVTEIRERLQKPAKALAVAA